jgi:hypothetical protein
MQTAILPVPRAIKFTLHKTKFVIELPKPKYVLYVIKSNVLKSTGLHGTRSVKVKSCAPIAITRMDQQGQAKWLEIVSMKLAFPVIWKNEGLLYITTPPSRKTAPFAITLMEQQRRIYSKYVLLFSANNATNPTHIKVVQPPLLAITVGIHSPGDA